MMDGEKVASFLFFFPSNLGDLEERPTRAQQTLAVRAKAAML